MGTTTKWGRAKLNSSTIGQTVTMRQQPAPKKKPTNTVCKSHQPLIPFQNRTSRRSKTLGFEWTQTTLRKTREETVRKRRKIRGSSWPAKEKNEQFATGERKRGSSQPEKEKGKRRRNAQQVGGRMFAKGSRPTTDVGEDDDCGLLAVEQN
ncbi:hypothetical protein Adt_10784 [Abeliophyllum distichum]|uniref:Uncharacterized protein n=1 Tax=Abeliophyllum distichum TaxID=126358 RepID=A0ABD1UL75_9LAMI